MIDCPMCKETIDADSIYCDQCGEVLMECPKCKTVRKGKFCTSCEYTKLIPRNEEALVTATPPQSPVSPASELNEDIPAGVSNNKIGKILSLSNSSLGINISLNASEQIGRKVGNFKDQFIPHQQISGKHAQINFDPQKGWSVVDLNSTNGTYINGKRIGSDPHPLQNNDILKLANLDFNVSIK